MTTSTSMPGCNKQLRTAICLDESIRHARDADGRRRNRAPAASSISKSAASADSREAKKVHDVCQAHNVPVWCGGMLESGIGRVHNIALSTLTNFRLPGRCVGFEALLEGRHYRARGGGQPRGTIAVSDAAGTGYRVREDLIEKLAVRKETFAA